MSQDEKFWENKNLDDLSDAQWESLCDGCGRCCLNKLEDEDTGEVHFTDIACKLLDTNSCRCTNYADRFADVPDCVLIRPLTEKKVNWLPNTCAYVKVYRGEPLEDWHPLISGNQQSVHAAGIGVGGRCVSETEVPFTEWEQHLVVFPE